MQLVDLSHRMAAGMPVYPGDPEVHVARALTLGDDGVEVHLLHVGSQSGTHIDAPSHTVSGGRTVDQIKLSEVIGSALVLDGRTTQTEGVVAWSDVAAQIPAQCPARVLVATGWDKHWGTPVMTDHPAIDVELAERLWCRGVRLLGTDALSPDPTGGDGFPVHEVVLGQDGLIVENLTGLGPLVGQVVEVALVPVAWTGLDGSTIRAWARLP